MNKLLLRWYLFLIIVLVELLHSQVGHFKLAKYYSPVIVQDLDCDEKYADYITRIDYDGDYIGNNNWNNLANFEDGDPVGKARPLLAYVYYSVIETETHYFICYALFHPTDDFYNHINQHENDLEGIIMCVFKDGNQYGQLRMVQTQAHWSFYQYKVPGAIGIDEKNEILDKYLGIGICDGEIITIPSASGGMHPVVFVEGGGHGIKNESKGSAPDVTYYYSGIAEDPDNIGNIDEENRSVGYDLLSIFAEMWEQRTNCRDYGGYLFDSLGAYNRKGFNIQGIGMKFDGDDGDDEDAASPPWDWDDRYDGDEWLSGDWFMHPAGYLEVRFNWDESFSTNYVFHPFGYAHLGDDIYNGAGGKTILQHGPYYVVRNVNILSGQTLVISSGLTINFNQNTRIIANGQMVANGENGTIYYKSTQNANRGIKLNGVLRAKNGGCVRIR